MEPTTSAAEQLYQTWQKEIDYAIEHLLRQHYETVQALKQHAMMDEDDLRQECLMKILQHADWLTQKQWIQSGKNPQGYFYQIAHNHLIDLWRRYERKGNTPHTTLDDIQHLQQPDPQPDQHEQLLYALAELVQYLENELRNTQDPERWIRYTQTKQSIYEKWLT